MIPVAIGVWLIFLMPLLIFSFIEIMKTVVRDIDAVPEYRRYRETEKISSTIVRFKR